MTGAAGLVELAAHPKVVGIGETGLDFYYEHSPRERQKRGLPRAYRGGARERACRSSSIPAMPTRIPSRLLEEGAAKGGLDRRHPLLQLDGNSG